MTAPDYQKLLLQARTELVDKMREANDLRYCLMGMVAAARADKHVDLKRMVELSKAVLGGKRL